MNWEDFFCYDLEPANTSRSRFSEMRGKEETTSASYLSTDFTIRYDFFKKKQHE